MALAGLFKALGTQAIKHAPPPKKLVLEKVDALDPKASRPVDVADAEVKASIDEKVAVDESERIINLDLGDYRLDDSAQPNFDMISEPDEIKAVIADFGARNKSSIDEARRNVIPDEQLKGLAADLDVKEDVVREVLTRETGGKLPPPEAILASRQVLNSSAERIKTLATKISAAEATDIEKLQFRRQMEFHKIYMQGFMGIRAEAGRSLRAFGIPVGGDETQIARMSELVETMHSADIEKTAKAISKIDSIQGINKVTREYTTSKIKGVLEEVFINSILSGIKTHVVNIGGNALFLSMNLSENAVATASGRMRYHMATFRGEMLSPEEMTYAGEAQAQLYGMIHGFRDGLRLVGKALKTGEASDTVRKLEMPIQKAISAENLELSGMFGRAVDYLGTSIRIPSERLLTAEDEFFKAVAMRGDLSRSAYREAMQIQGQKGLDDTQTAEVLRRLMENPPDEMLAKSHDAALYATFQNPLGKRGREIQGFINHVPGLKFLAPFVRTPTNIFKAAFAERTPLGLFSQRIRDQIAKGVPERDLALARMSMGTITASSVALYAASGTITGGGPSNPAARKTLQATGWRPYSIRIVGPGGKVTYQSYARAEPLAYIIGATADAVEILQYSNIDPELDTTAEQINTMAAAIVAGIAQNTMSKTFVSGIARFIQAMEDSPRYFKSWSQGMAGAMVPYSAFRRDLSRIQDPVIREAWSIGQKMRVSSGIPGWSEGAPARLDIFGEEQFHPQGTFLGIASPYPSKRQTRDPVKLAVAELMRETNRVPITMPGKRINGARLTEQEYHDYVDLSRNEVDIDGMTFLTALSSMMDTQEYDESMPDMKVDKIKTLQKLFDREARRTLLRENDDLNERVMGRRVEAIRRQYGDEAADRIEMMQ